jgi:hypothetical protein
VQQVYCDHCKRRITLDDEAVYIRVNDRSRPYDAPERLSRMLDLHRACYVEAYQATIDQAVDTDTDTDPTWG